MFTNTNNNNVNEIDIWIKNPSMLFDKNTIIEIWPTQKMCYERKINAMSRLIILLTILGFILTRSVKIVIVGVITLIVIYLFYYQNWYKYSSNNNKESFASGNVTDNDNTYNPVVNVNSTNSESGVPLKQFVKDNYQTGSKYNPLSNVLLPEIMDDPTRKSAPPDFNPDVSNDIRQNVKKMVQMLNPTIKCSSKQLFSSLGDNFDLDQSIRPFMSTANTRIPNDQGAFAQYLYDDMKFSGKENTIFGAVARVQDNYRYIDP
jgi:hypothetical protein